MYVWSEHMRVFARIASRAGRLVMDARAATVARLKADGSPVTDADEHAEALIVAELAKAMPDIPIIGEEMAARGEIDTDEPVESVILVDALDGTKEYLRGSSHFTVNIALVVAERVALGCVYAPALAEMFIGGAAFGSYHIPHLPPGTDPEKVRLKGLSASCDAVGVNDRPRAVVSRSHPDSETQAFLEEHDIEIAARYGSSLKLCRLAQGMVEVYPRFGPTMEWDIAAGQAIVEGAGGFVLTGDGETLAYGKANRRNGAFVAWSARGREMDSRRTVGNLA